MPPAGPVRVAVGLGARSDQSLRAFVAGAGDAYVRVDHGGPMSRLAPRPAPPGACTPPDRPLDEITGRPVEAEEIGGADARRRAEALPEEPARPLRFALAAALPLRRAATGPRPLGEVIGAWRRLVEEAGWRRRHLTVRFRRQIGPRPKTLGLITRFSGVPRQMEGPGPVRWARLAAGCGYYDRHHPNTTVRPVT